ncbi:family 2 glycosyl transferase [Pedobacter yulinensis]|uniref:Family 2 glycosyl transferase n=1 Tax=Pedobacter yulinensis TaxID=2126353 RepID=A0A2T3HK39_9SPHI|nr:glycosyltransferase family A protein [Pedobacter yulinensis]PST82807.1 family 2 glycosyl transferase [Pedobacter yulinensis]
MQIKVSVVIPTYNRTNLLLNCLDSLRKQQLDKALFEVIVVSDGPDPKTEAALKTYINKQPVNFRYLHTSVKKGPAAARNLGWLTARGTLVAFTDDDCLPDRNWLKHLVRAATTDEPAAFTGTTIVPTGWRVSDHALNTKGLETAEFITANCAVSKQALILTGGFDERFEVAWREDSDLQFRLLEHSIGIKKVAPAVVVHPVRSGRFGLSLSEQKKGMYDVLLYKKYPAFYRQKIQPRPLWFYYVVNALWVVLLISVLKAEWTAAGIAAAGLGLLLFGFALKRLYRTSKTARDIAEMLVTSLVIPTLSVYWRMVGNIRYKTALL